MLVAWINHEPHNGAVFLPSSTIHMDILRGTRQDRRRWWDLIKYGLSVLNYYLFSIMMNISDEINDNDNNNVDTDAGADADAGE